MCTGVYNPHSPLPGDQNFSEMVFHGNKDLKVESELVEPSHVVEDVEAAVDLMLQQESFNTWHSLQTDHKYSKAATNWASCPT